jgi:hypothetical protein
LKSTVERGKDWMARIEPDRSIHPNKNHIGTSVMMLR